MVCWGSIFIPNKCHCWLTAVLAEHLAVLLIPGSRSFAKCFLAAAYVWSCMLDLFISGLTRPSRAACSF